MPASYLTVFSYALLTALATGLGVLPFLFVKHFSERWLGISNAIAAGLMLSASFQLIYEALNYSVFRSMFGVVLGLLFISTMHTFIEHRNLSGDVSELQKATVLKAFLIMSVMTLHSFAEGVGVGVSFGNTMSFGVFITLAIALHNVPEGLAIALVMVPRGAPIWQAGLWAVVSSLPQPFMALPAYAFVNVFEPFLPVGLGLAAGAMIWMVFAELIPETEGLPEVQRGTTITLAIVGMTLFQALIG